MVTSCFVRDGAILADAVSTNEGVHSEYALLQRLSEKGISITDTDTVFTTVEPCGHRTPNGPGERMGDCTTNLINAGVKHIVFATADPDASVNTRHKFRDAEVGLRQTSDSRTIVEATRLFNATSDEIDHLPEG